MCEITESLQSNRKYYNFPSEEGEAQKNMPQETQITFDVLTHPSSPQSFLKLEILTSPEIKKKKNEYCF